MIKCVATKIFFPTLKFIVNLVHTLQIGQRISFEKAWWRGGARGFGDTQCTGSQEWKESQLATGGSDEKESRNINPQSPVRNLLRVCCF